VTEVFLKEMVRLYPEDKLEQGKTIIEYFTQNYTDDEAMGELFAKNFERVDFTEDIGREEEILIDDNYCFKKEIGKISLELLWKVALEEANERREAMKNTTDYHEELYYSYYFLLFSLRNPRTGLQKLDRISYNL
jgi:hypothetical protein